MGNCTDGVFCSQTPARNSIRRLQRPCRIPVDTQTPEPEDGLEGVEAKMAADGLMSAALAMAGAGVHKRKSTAAIRKEVRLFLITSYLHGQLD